MRKIYLASSWKNEKEVLQLAKILRTWDNKVFAFCERGKNHYVFDAKDWKGKDLSTFTPREAYQHPAFKQAYLSDKDGLDWSNTCVLLLPCGKSSHLEAGYAVGRDKDVFIYNPIPIQGNYDVMYGFALNILENLEELQNALTYQGKYNGEIT